MDFSRTKHERELYQRILLFAQNNLNNNTADGDQQWRFSRELWQKCADEGLLSLIAPTQYGGQALGAGAAAYAMEALGQGCEDNGLCFALGAQLWSVQHALTQSGNQDQLQRYLPGMLSGETIVAFAITESSSGSDAFALNTTAIPDGDHYVLNGEKIMITFAPVADVAIVFAMTNPDAKQWGISAFLVESELKGFKASQNQPKMGLRSVPFGSITLNNCRVPRTALLGKAGSGASLFNNAQSWERSLVLAPQLGAMQRLIDQCVELANSKIRDGVSIGSHQAVSHRIANMRIRLESSRLLLYRTAWMLEQGQQTLMEAAITKTHVSEAFVETCHDAIAIFGGAGYISANGIERQLRDAIGATIYGGTVDIQRNIITRLLDIK